MEDFLNKPILDQLYISIMEDFKKTIYEKDSTIREIEESIQDKKEKLIELLEKEISNPKDLNKILNLFREHELNWSKQIDFWNKTYFKLGLTERKELLGLLFPNNKNNEDNETFLNCGLDGFSEWIEEQKNKCTFGTKEYKDLKKRYKEISEKYPNVINVFEDLEPTELTKDEIKALVELRNIDITMGHMEKFLCFKLGMKEVIYF